MNGSVPFNGRQYHILYVSIHGGSGMGASEAYNGRYYLVSPEMWEKEKGNYLMIHQEDQKQYFYRGYSKTAGRLGDLYVLRQENRWHINAGVNASGHENRIRHSLKKLRRILFC